jgi:hypothetical protein
MTSARRLAPTLALALALLALAARPARAQDPRFPVAVDAQPALGSSSTYAGWVPVFVSLRNDGAEEVHAHVRLVAKHRYYSDQDSCEVDREEDLAPKVEKRFFLYAPLASTQEQLVLRVERPGGAPLAQPLVMGGLTVQEPEQSAYSQEALARLGVVSRRVKLELWAALKTSFGNRYTNAQSGSTTLNLDVVTVDPAALPDRRIGYSSLDALLLHDVDFASLSPEQRAAIREWTQAGGRLIVSPGADAGWLRDPFFEDLLPPGKPTATSRTSFFHSKRASPPYLHFALEGATGEPIVRDVGELPLATRYRAGLGEVVLLGFDIAAGPFEKDEKARDAFWRELVKAAVPPREAGRAEAVASGAPDRGGHALLRTREDTPILLIALFAAVYVFAIGPANFFLLRRRGREPLMVLSIPLIACTFTLGTFAAGYGFRGVRLRVREVECLEARLGDRVARATRFLGIEPARSTRIDVTLDPGEAALPVAESRRDESVRFFRIEEGERERIRDLPLMPWELGVIEADSVRDLGGALEIERRADGVVIAKNGTSLRLTKVLVPGGANAWWTGALGPGQSAALERQQLEHGWEDVLAAYPEASLERRALTWAGGRAWRAIALFEPPPQDSHRTPAADAGERAAVIVFGGEERP